MNNEIFLFSNYSSYVVPLATAGFGYIAMPNNKIRNAAIGGVAGLGLIYLLNQVAEGDIGNFLNNRRLNTSGFRYTDRDTAIANLTLTANGIADINPVLPRPTATVDQPNAIDLPGGKVLLIPPPTSWDAFYGN